MPNTRKLTGLAMVLAMLFAAGALLAGALSAATTTAETTTTTATATDTTTSVTTTTAPASTVYTTTTVLQTTTRLVPVGTTSTTASSSSEGNGTPDWVWVLLGILAVGLIVLIVLLARRGGSSGGGISAEARQHRLTAVVGTWVAQGWAVESQTADSAVLRRGSESMLVSVDPAGNTSTQPLPPT